MNLFSIPSLTVIALLLLPLNLTGEEYSSFLKHNDKKDSTNNKQNTNSNKDSLLFRQSEKLDFGYFTREKSAYAGSLSAVKGKSLEYLHTQNFTQALAGQIPGLTVLTRSGEPGYEDNQLMVHGINSMYVAKPIILVDVDS